MKVDPHCPVDVTGYEILLDDRGNARAYIRLRNMAKLPASRLSAIVVWRGANGDTFSTSVEATNLLARAGERFTLTASTDKPRRAESLDVLFSSVGFGRNAPMWRADAQNVVETPPQPLATGEELRMLAYWAGDDAVAFPVSDERVWMCVCARANPIGAERCSRCGRTRAETLNEYAKEALYKRPKPPNVPLNVTLPIKPRDAVKDDEIRLMRRQRAMLIRRSAAMLSLAAIIAIVAFIASNAG